jgi:hypothetical protein
MSTFWSTQAPLTILKESYRPPHAAYRIIDTPILASTSSGYPYASIVQHVGRERKRVTFTAHVSSWGYYEALETDRNSGEVRYFVGPEGSSDFTAQIEKLGEPQWFWPDDIRFSVVLVEAST